MDNPYFKLVDVEVSGGVSHRHRAEVRATDSVDAALQHLDEMIERQGTELHALMTARDALRELQRGIAVYEEPWENFKWRKDAERARAEQSVS